MYYKSRALLSYLSFNSRNYEKLRLKLVDFGIVLRYNTCFCVTLSFTDSELAETRGVGNNVV